MLALWAYQWTWPAQPPAAAGYANYSVAVGMIGCGPWPQPWQTNRVRIVAPPLFWPYQVPSLWQRVKNWAKNLAA